MCCDKPEVVTAVMSENVDEVSPQAHKDIASLSTDAVSLHFTLVLIFSWLNILSFIATFVALLFHLISALSVCQISSLLSLLKHSHN